MVTRRAFLKTAGAGALVAGTPVSWGAGGTAPAKKPNIIMILADDMGWSDIGCYGGEIDTPNLDGLAKRGLRLTQMHNTSKCFPSRACLLTGVYAQQCNMGRRHGSIENALTLGEVLRPAGYRTLAAGKHHGTENLYHRGFDRYFGLRDGCCNYFNPGDQRPGEPAPARKRARHWCIDEKTYHPYTPPQKDFYTVDYFTNYAVDYLEEYKDENKPFLLYLAYKAPHDPLQAWPKDIEKYRGKYMAGYAAVRQARYERQKKLGVVDESMPLSESEFKDWQKLSEEGRTDQDLRMATYAAMIDCMDRNIGRLIKKLEELGELENTLIMFASDNGCSAEFAEGSFNKKYKEKQDKYPIGHMARFTSLGRDWANVSDTPFRKYKNYSYEGGICTPFIAFWPGVIKDGGISDAPAHFIDVMATLVDITGADYPERFKGKTIVPLQGQSLLPLFRGEEFARKKPLFWEWRSQEAVHWEGWKAIRSKKKAWQLYSMKKDKTETRDVAGKHPDVVARLDRLYTAWKKGWKG